MKKKGFNWAEVHLSEVTSYKIHILVFSKFCLKSYRLDWQELAVEILVDPLFALCHHQILPVTCKLVSYMVSGPLKP